MSEPVAAARMASRARASDRYDRLGPAFHARVAAGFRAIAAGEPQRCHLVDANGDTDTVFADLIRKLSSLCLWERVGLRGAPHASAVGPGSSPNPPPQVAGFRSPSGTP